MAIVSNRTGIIGKAFPLRSSGSNRLNAATYHPSAAHTHSMLAQASRVPRLANITSVQQMLTAHAGKAATRGKK